MKTIIGQAFGLLRQHLKAYIVLNIICYGIIALVMYYSINNPQIHIIITGALSKGMKQGLLGLIYNVYYIHPNFLLAVFATFFVNLLLGAFLVISIPSFIIPFSGWIMLGLRFVSWGFLFPSDTTGYYSLPVLFLEGQGYILAAFSIYIFETRFLMPKRFNMVSHKDGFLEGIKLSGTIYMLAAIVLFISAITEVTLAFNISHKALFPKYIKADIEITDDSVQTWETHSTFYYDKINIKSDEARVAAVLLEDIDYLQSDVRREARLSHRGLYHTIEINIPKSSWDDERIQKRFSVLLKKLHKYYPAISFEIVLYEFDKSGKRDEKLLN